MSGPLYQAVRRLDELAVERSLHFADLAVIGMPSQRPRHLALAAYYGGLHLRLTAALQHAERGPIDAAEAVLA